ncbi:MAG: amidase [Bacteroidales bacterium]|nr:amidase [Bacteroidales bacterium]
MKIFNLSLSESINAIQNETIEVEDLINSICDRIDRLEPLIHSLIPEIGRRNRLLREARDLKQKYPDKNKRPILFGIPIGVKDLFRVDGFPTQAGSKLPTNLFEEQESSVVTALKNAGALILGKTVTTEFAYFEPGPTCNPHNLSHTPGGSSSGSAAAVVCGLTPLALGTQTIGSITRPASFCGVYGYKPSYKRISTNGVIPFSVSADHIGFFTQDLQGIEIVASLLCNHWNPATKTSHQKPVIGIAVGSYLEQSNDEVLSLFDEKTKQLEQLGFKIVKVDTFGDIESINKAHKSMIAVDFSKVHEKWFENFEGLYRENTKKLIIEGRTITKKIYQDALAGREMLRTQLEVIKSINKIDIWLSPSSCSAATEGLDSTGSPLMNLPWTYAGLPTVSVPAMKTSNHLPIGLQFVGSFNQDEDLIAKLKLIVHFL